MIRPSNIEVKEISEERHCERHKWLSCLKVKGFQPDRVVRGGLHVDKECGRIQKFRTLQTARTRRHIAKKDNSTRRPEDRRRSLICIQKFYTASLGPGLSAQSTSIKFSFSHWRENIGNLFCSLVSFHYNMVLGSKFLIGQ